jgi:aldehyde dehydrogenase (NAD+)
MTDTLRSETRALLTDLGVTGDAIESGALSVTSPITGEAIAEVGLTPASNVSDIIARAHSAYLRWRTIPAPRRGELVRLAKNCARIRTRWVDWYRSRWARSSPKASARSKR